MTENIKDLAYVIIENQKFEVISSTIPADLNKKDQQIFKDRGFAS